LTGNVVNDIPKQCGSVCGLNHDNVQYLLWLDRDNLDYFLNELLNLLKTNHFISIHYTTLQYTKNSRVLELAANDCSASPSSAMKHYKHNSSLVWPDLNPRSLASLMRC
jgi:hypothetical protein